MNKENARQIGNNSTIGNQGHSETECLSLSATARQSPFNDRGIVEQPCFTTVRPQGKNHQFEFTVTAHAIADTCWIAEPSWYSTAGINPGHCAHPSRSSTPFQTRSEAVEDAFNRGIRQIKNDLGALQEEANWSNRLNSLIEWVTVAIEQVRENDEQLPLRKSTVIDLACGGLGGFGFGLKSLGAEVVLACDIDSTARQIYQANVKPKSMHDDICTLDGTNLKCDILTMGLMCQAFSIAGKGLGLDDPKLSNAYKHSLRLLTEIDAQVIVIECVKQLLTLANGDDARIVRDTLLKAGYRVQHRTLNTKGFGLAQNRERAFIVATKNGLQIDGVLGYLFPSEKMVISTVEDIIDEHIGGTIEAARLHPVRQAPTSKVDRLFEVARLDGRNSQGYRVYSTKGIGCTLTAMGGGHGKTGLYMVKDKARPLTPREAYRMQGMPEWTVHHSKHTHACKHAGNAVAIPVVREIGRMLSTTIASFKEGAAKAAAKGGAL